MEPRLLDRVRVIPSRDRAAEPRVRLGAARSARARVRSRDRVDDCVGRDRPRDVGLPLPAMRRAVLLRVRRAAVAAIVAAQSVRAAVPPLRPAEVGGAGRVHGRHVGSRAMVRDVRDCSRPRQASVTTTAARRVPTRHIARGIDQGTRTRIPSLPGRERQRLANGSFVSEVRSPALIDSLRENPAMRRIQSPPPRSARNIVSSQVSDRSS
jgi:hypothetical protein